MREARKGTDGRTDGQIEELTLPTLREITCCCLGQERKHITK